VLLARPIKRFFDRGSPKKDGKLENGRGGFRKSFFPGNRGVTANAEPGGESLATATGERGEKQRGVKKRGFFQRKSSQSTEENGKRGTGLG